jgi:hypothetical protein
MRLKRMKTASSIGHWSTLTCPQHSVRETFHWHMRQPRNITPSFVRVNWTWEEKERETEEKHNMRERCHAWTRRWNVNEDKYEARNRDRLSRANFVTKIVSRPTQAIRHRWRVRYITPRAARQQLNVQLLSVKFQDWFNISAQVNVRQLRETVR